MKLRTSLALLLTLLACTLARCSPGPDAAVSGIPQETLSVIQATLDAQAPMAVATAQAWMTEAAPQEGGQGNELRPPTLPTGGIRGELSYPDEERIPLTVTAFNVETGEYYSVEVKDNNQYWLEDVPLGQYRVAVYTQERKPRAAAYTQAVVCGLTPDCTDHSLIIITVKADELTENVDPVDWGVAEGEVPLTVNH